VIEVRPETSRNILLLKKVGMEIAISMPKEFIMLVENQIDQLIFQLQNLRQSLSNASSQPVEIADDFNDIFENAVSILDKVAQDPQPEEEIQTTLLNKSVDTQRTVDPTPHWFNSNQPKAPSSMQLMEIMTGKPPSEIFQLPNFKEVNSIANDLIYGVIGDKPDLRDWNKILTSGDIVETLRVENAKLLQPQISIQTNFSNNGDPVASTVIVSDNEGNTLRLIQGASEGLVDTLRNFGITRTTVDKDLNGYIWDKMEARTKNQILNSPAWA